MNFGKDSDLFLHRKQGINNLHWIDFRISFISGKIFYLII